MANLDSILQQLNQLKLFASKHALFLIISLSSSREDFDNCYLGGLRITESFLLVSIVNLSQKNIDSLSSFINDNVDAILVDVEKKHPFQNNITSSDSQLTLQPTFSNIFAAAFELCKNTHIIPWSPSLLTAQSAITRIRTFAQGNLSGSHVTVVGLGSIGFKIALSLVEEGSNVSCFSRNVEKTTRLVQAINDLKSPYTISSASYYSDINTAVASSPYLVLCANSSRYITSDNLLFKDITNSFILDISKNSLDASTYQLISKVPSLTYQRLDIGNEIVKLVYSHLSPSLISSRPFRFKFMHNNKEFSLVSGGMNGFASEIVVDSALVPTFVHGTFDTNGIYIANEASCLFTDFISSLDTM